MTAVRKGAILCGALSSVVYGALIWVIPFEGHDILSQAPSEITAIGAPRQPVWIALAWVYTALMLAFGWGVLSAARHKRPLNIVGALILFYGSLGFLWPLAPMHTPDVLAAGGGTRTDTMHLALAGTSVLVMFLTIGFGATAFGPRFRRFSMATIAVLLGFGALTFHDAPNLDAGLPTPWMGLWERINISAFLVWIAALSITLRRAQKP